MLLRMIKANETEKLVPCLAALADYHNGASANFKGCYPARAPLQTARAFKPGVAAGSSLISVLEEAGTVAGFCKIDVDGANGKLDYLIVLPKYRGQNYGAQLMDWALAEFAARGVTKIEVKVVAGSSALAFYEKYGFKINAYLLWKREEL